MSVEEPAEFRENPLLDDILRVRNRDEQAKDPEAVVPGFESHRGMLVMHKFRLYGTPFSCSLKFR